MTGIAGYFRVEPGMTTSNALEAGQSAKKMKMRILYYENVENVRSDFAGFSF